MKRFVLVLGVVCFVFFTIVSTSFAGVQDFALVNNTGVTIHGVFVSPVSSEGWEQNLLLNEATFGPGEAAPIHFEKGVEACAWDLLERCGGATVFIGEILTFARRL